MLSESNLLVIAASNGENLQLAKRFIKIGDQLGTKSELLDLTCLDLPLYNPRTHAQNGIPSLIKQLSLKMAALPTG